MKVAWRLPALQVQTAGLPSSWEAVGLLLSDYKNMSIFRFLYL